MDEGKVFMVGKAEGVGTRVQQWGGRGAYGKSPRGPGLFCLEVFAG